MFWTLAPVFDKSRRTTIEYLEIDIGGHRELAILARLIGHSLRTVCCIVSMVQGFWPAPHRARYPVPLHPCIHPIKTRSNHPKERNVGLPAPHRVGGLDGLIQTGSGYKNCPTRHEPWPRGSKTVPSLLGTVR